MLEALAQDTRYALRLLRRSPVFTLTAALSLAIGIGANATIFSVVSAMLLRPLPGLAEPSRLVDIGRTQDGAGFDTVSYPNYRDIVERATTLSDVYAYRLEPQPISLNDGRDTERIYGALVTGNYLRALGTTTVRGRLLDAADDRIGSPPVAVIAYDLWRRRFDGSDDAVGRTVTFNGQPVTIIGVAPPGFQGTTLMRSDTWLPLSLSSVAAPRLGERLFKSRDSVWLVMGGRLKSSVTLAQANAELDAIGTALRREYPDANRGKGLEARPASVVPGQKNIVTGFLALLLALVGLVLLVACVNIAGMLIARAAARRREIAVRLAIGASRSRLVRQLLTETIVLFSTGCLLGLILSQWLTRVLLALLPQLPVPVGVDIAIDWRVVAFTIAISFGCAVLSGMAPAFQASRPDLVPALKIDGAGADGGRLRLRSAFIIGQVALSLVLIIAAGLFIRALGRAASIQPGFDQTNVDVVTMDISLSGYSKPDALAFARTLTERVGALPGVQSAAFAADLPIDGGRMGLGSLRAPGVQARGGRTTFDEDWNVITPGFFRTLNIPLVRGRDFTEEDVAGAPGAIIVNETLAKRVWGTSDVIGRQLIGDDDEGAGTWTVVGVAGDAQMITLGGTVEPYVYVPLNQRYIARVSLLVKSTDRGTIPRVRALLRTLNPNQPVTVAMPLSDVTAIGLIPQRIAAAVAGSLGVVVLLLAAIGIYGAMSYQVNRRVREIGVRMALGADRATVLRLVLRQGVLLTTTGIVLGLIAGAAGAQVLRSLLFGISALDPTAFAGAAFLFGVVSLVAAYLPARRATRVDPVVALRAE
jgi:putative ABC transport system permease protein